MKTDIVYADETLTVYFEGNINKKSFNDLKKKLYNIIDEYQINDIVFDLENASYSDSNLNKLLEDYNLIYNNNIKIKR